MDLLSQDEIDALLHGVDDGDVDTDDDGDGSGVGSTRAALCVQKMRPAPPRS